MAQVFRTFVAIELPETVKTKAMQIIRRYEKWSQYRWVNADSLHLTLNFVGDVTQQEISPLCRKLESIIQSTPPFHVSLKGLGAFPKPDRPRVIWLGVDEGYPQIESMYSQVGELLESMKYDKDRHKFQPHVTLGRIKRDRRFDPDIQTELDAESELDAGAFSVNEVVVFESVPEKSGPRYTPLARVKLKG